jgi:hypothetical protein
VRKPLALVCSQSEEGHVLDSGFYNVKIKFVAWRQTKASNRLKNWPQDVIICGLRASNFPFCVMANGAVAPSRFFAPEPLQLIRYYQNPNGPSTRGKI